MHWFREYVPYDVEAGGTEKNTLSGDSHHACKCSLLDSFCPRQSLVMSTDGEISMMVQEDPLAYEMKK